MCQPSIPPKRLPYLLIRFSGGGIVFLFTYYFVYSPCYDVLHQVIEYHRHHDVRIRRQSQRRENKARSIVVHSQSKHERYFLGTVQLEEAAQAIPGCEQRET